MYLFYVDELCKVAKLVGYQKNNVATFVNIMYLHNGHSSGYLPLFRKLEQHSLQKIVQKTGEELLIELPSMKNIHSNQALKSGIDKNLSNVFSLQVQR